MAFATGLLLIDAPASALNNSGSIQDELYGNKVAVKAMRSGRDVYPYVSAQSFRYWLRSTLENGEFGWKAAPIYREGKVAYTDANPISWWDDDLFGYMRSPKTGAAAQKVRADDPEYQKLTPLEINGKDEQTVTRISPFRVSTLVAIAPADIVEHFESMSRHEGDPVPYSGQFYRATLCGLLSLDLAAAGTFSYRNRTGYRNLDSVRIELAKKQALEHLEDVNAYRLSVPERVARISALFNGLAHLEGGAKQALHYTDVAPALSILAITKGGNHIFGHVIGADRKGQPQIKIEALLEALTVHADDLLSDVYLGWVRGYLDEERARFENALAEGGALATYASGANGSGPSIRILHPREAFKAFVTDLKNAENAHWLA